MNKFYDASKLVEMAEEIVEVVRQPLPKKMGVWVNGALRFQSRDRDAIDAYAARKMRERHNVWVAPIGSFVVV